MNGYESSARRVKQHLRVRDGRPSDRSGGITSGRGSSNRMQQIGLDGSPMHGNLLSQRRAAGGSLVANGRGGLSGLDSMRPSKQLGSVIGLHGLNIEID